MTFFYLSFLMLMGAGWRVARCSAKTAATTAESARLWALAAIGTCILACGLQLMGNRVPPQASSATHYFAAVMLLTPLVSILGARRPGAKAWPWFVILPLILILQWPSVSQITSSASSLPVEIPTPTILGFLFVLLMGAGNYFGTQNTLSMMWGTAGIVLFLLPITEWMRADTQWAFVVGSALITLCAWTADLRPRKSGHGAMKAECVKQLWSSFQMLYGIVWTKRVMDRVNQMLARESLDVQLSMEGFEAKFEATGPEVGAPSESEIDIPDRAVQILCWVLRRFVDQSFLRQFLPDSMIGTEREDST